MIRRYRYAHSTFVNASTVCKDLNSVNGSKQLHKVYFEEVNGKYFLEIHFVCILKLKNHSYYKRSQWKWMRYLKELL